MSETWTSLLSGVVGAIVGGAASLAGTMLVNRMQMANNARMRMYDQLLPELDGVVADLNRMHLATGWDWVSDYRAKASETVRALERASSIAGREERAAAHKLASRWAEAEQPITVWVESRSKLARAANEEVEEALSPLGEEMQIKNQAVLNELRAVSELLKAKLG
jgi:hypothetical protein